MNKKKAAPFLFLVVPVTLYALFYFLPTLSVFWLGLNKWTLRPEIFNPTFDPYIKLFTDPEFYTAIIHNVLMVINSVFIQVPFAFFVAYLLSKPEASRFRTIFTSIYFLPVAISLVAVSLTWSWMVQPGGLVNSFFASVGLDSLSRPWFSQVTRIFPYFNSVYLMLMIAINWTWFGFYVIIFLAGLKEIPEQYFEAARLEGLSEWKKLRHIALPNLKNIWFICIVLAVAGSFKAFSFIWASTQGGPGNASSVGGTLLYRTAFKHFNMGYASTIGSIVAVIGIILILVVLRREGWL